MFTKSPPQTQPLTERKRRIYNFLISNPVGVISSITSQDRPHGSVIYFSIEPDFKISFLTRSNTRKSANIAHNNQVMLTAFDVKSQTVAQLAGKAVRVSDSYEVNGIAGAVLGSSLRTEAGGLLPIAKLEAGSFIGFRITPQSAWMARYKANDIGTYADLFESVESFDLDTV